MVRLQRVRINAGIGEGDCERTKRREKGRSRMKHLKELLWGALCGVFALSAAACAWQVILRVLLRIHQHQSLWNFRNVRVPAALSIIAIIYVLASWTVGKGKRSARAWGLMASVVNLVLASWSVIFFSRPVHGSMGVLLAVGAIGVVAFLWPSEQVRQEP